jgi:hypothetical protein
VAVLKGEVHPVPVVNCHADEYRRTKGDKSRRP